MTSLAILQYCNIISEISSAPFGHSSLPIAIAPEYLGQT